MRDELEAEEHADRCASEVERAAIEVHVVDIEVVDLEVAEVAEVAAQPDVIGEIPHDAAAEGVPEVVTRHRIQSIEVQIPPEQSRTSQYVRPDARSALAADRDPDHERGHGRDEVALRDDG